MLNDRTQVDQVGFDADDFAYILALMSEQQSDERDPLPNPEPDSGEFSDDTLEIPRVPDSTLDYVLQALVYLTNDTDVEFGITLTVSGFLISGTLISGKRFFEGIAKEMSDAFPSPDTKESIRQYFAAFGAIYDDPKVKQSGQNPIFVHMRDARLFHNSGKPIPGNRGVFWRGRISQVSGFNMGNLSAE